MYFFCFSFSYKLQFYLFNFNFFFNYSFVFTTEGHLLPLSLARLSPSTAVPVSKIPRKKSVFFLVESKKDKRGHPFDVRSFSRILDPLPLVRLL